MFATVGLLGSRCLAAEERLSVGGLGCVLLTAKQGICSGLAEETTGRLLLPATSFWSALSVRVWLLTEQSTSSRRTEQGG